MRVASRRFLEQLLAAPSPSGYEAPALTLFADYIRPYCYVSSDLMGNTYGHIAGEGENLPTVMLVGHCDEIGLQIKYIDDNGFLYIAAIGGVDAHLTPGKVVTVHTAQGPITGVVGKKPIHLMDAKDRETVVKLDAQYIDIGATSKKEADKIVRVGDCVTFAAGISCLLGDRIASRGLDDKAGAFVVAEVLRLVATRKLRLPVDLVGVASVQEEVGLRGGTTSAYTVNPDIGICVEVDFATDQPDVERKHNGTVKVGGGPILARGPNINHRLFDELFTAARRRKIPVQVTAIPRATGTDANPMQISRGGTATALVKLPLRYMHTPVEVCSLGDLEKAAELIVEVLTTMPNREAFYPAPV